MMKRTIVLFVMILLFAGCKDEAYIINGKVVRRATGEGIPNQQVQVLVRKVNGSGYFATTEHIPYEAVSTDANGNFSIPIKYVDDATLMVTVESNDEYAGGGNSYLPLDEDILVNVDKYVKFKIHVNNVNPYDEDDFVWVDLFSGFVQPKRTEIENFGVENVIYPAQSNGIGERVEASWYGANVNSTVHYSVPESAEIYKLQWRIRKNNIETTGFTETIEYEIDEVNEYYFNY